jgi:hypothetical protein
MFFTELRKAWNWRHRASADRQVHRRRSTQSEKAVGKAWRSLVPPTPDTAVWDRSPDVPVWRDGGRTCEREWLKSYLQHLLTP